MLNGLIIEHFVVTNIRLKVIIVLLIKMFITRRMAESYTNRQGRYITHTISTPETQAASDYSL